MKKIQILLSLKNIEQQKKNFIYERSETKLYSV